MPPPSIPHLYVHIPFCPTICPFCSFHVLRRRDDLVDAYLRRLDEELAATALAWAGTGPLHSVYLGGGTPTQLTDAELERLLASVRRHFVLDGRAEVGIEAHPSTVRPERPPRWRDLGINRVSVGVQSTHDAVLRRLGRPHDAAAALAALDAVLAVDGWSVNADLIVAVPGQGPDEVAADLRRVAERGVHHLAAYTLTIEPATPFERRGVVVDEEAERSALQLAVEVLPDFGLHRYEVSNHARPGHECAHNLGYWRGACWFGAGPSATAQLPAGAGGIGRHLVRNAALAGWLRGEAPAVEALTQEDVRHAQLLTGVRLADGVDARLLGLPCGHGERGAALQRLCEDGLLERRGDRVAATAAGVLVLDQVLAQLW